MIDLVVLQGYSTIQLTRGQNTLVDSLDYAELARRKWHAYPSHGTYYAVRTIRDYREGRLVTRSVRMHRAVLETRVGPCPPGLECRHLNGDPLDNRAGNLAWGTHSENARDGMRHGTWTGAFRLGVPCLHNRGERNGSARLKASDIPEIRRLAAAGQTQLSLSRRYGVSRMAIYKILEGKSWSHVA